MKSPLPLIVLLLLAGCTQEQTAPQPLSSGQDTLASPTLVTRPGEIQSLSYEQRQGKQLYEKYCAVCHGQQGKGDGFNAYNLDPKPRDFTDGRYMSALSDARLLETISQGGRGVNKSVLMPSWGGRLTGIERTYVVEYVRRLGKRTNGEVARK